MSDSLWTHGLYSPWNSPGQNIGVDSCSILQGIFPTQGSNPGLSHCGLILCCLSHQKSPLKSLIMFYLGNLWRTIAWEIASQIGLRDCTKELTEEPWYIVVSLAKKKKKKVKHQKNRAKDKSQTSQVNDFSAFLFMGRCESLGLLKSFLRYAS